MWQVGTRCALPTFHPPVAGVCPTHWGWQCPGCKEAAPAVGSSRGQKHQPPLTPASHHHTWETNSLQLNPQESIQGMLPGISVANILVISPGCLSHLGGGLRVSSWGQKV